MTAPISKAKMPSRERNVSAKAVRRRCVGVRKGGAGSAGTQVKERGAAAVASFFAQDGGGPVGPR